MNALAVMKRMSMKKIDMTRIEPRRFELDFLPDNFILDSY